MAIRGAVLIQMLYSVKRVDVCTYPQNCLCMSSLADQDVHFVKTGITQRDATCRMCGNAAESRPLHYSAGRLKPLSRNVYLDKKVHVHYRGSMDLVHIRGPWTWSKLGCPLWTAGRSMFRPHST